MSGQPPERIHRINPFLRHPALSLAASLLIALPLAWQWRNLDVRSETSVLLEGDQRNQGSYEKVVQILKEDVVVVFSVQLEDVFSQSGMQSVRRISESFRNQPGFLDTKSFTHSVKPIRRGLSFSMVPLVSQNPDAAELEALRRFSLDNPLIRNVMVSADARNTILLNTYRRKLETREQQQAFAREIDAILKPFRDEGITIRVLALPLIEEEVRATVIRDIRLFVPTAIAVLIVILLIAFRSVALVVFSLLIHAAVLVILPGVMKLTGQDLTVFSIPLFPLLAAVHLNLLVHLFSSLRRHIQHVEDTSTVFERVLGEVFQPSLFAAITTVIGLLCLNVSAIKPVRDFGNMGALGVAALWLITFGPGLAFIRLGLPFARLRQDRPVEPPQSPGISASLWESASRPVILVPLTVLCVAVTLIGLSRLRTDVRAVEFLSPRSPTRLAVEMLDAAYGGVNVVQIDIDTGRQGGINNLEFIRYLERMQNHAESLPEISGAYSYAQLLALMNQIWEQEKPGSLHVPKDSLTLGIFTLALKTQRLPFIAALSDPENRVARLIIRTRDMPARAYLDVIQRIVAHARAQAPPGISVSAAEGIHTILEADRQVLESQIQSAGFSTGVIFLVLTLLWRSPILAALSVMVNAIPVSFALSIAGYTGIPLNSITVMVGAIAFGIAVDDSVHFLTYWRQMRRQGCSASDAVRRTLEVKTRPIIGSSLVLIGLMCVFCLSSFPPVIHFGLLAAAAFAAALVSVLVLLPPLLRGPIALGSHLNIQQTISGRGSLDTVRQ